MHSRFSKKPSMSRNIRLCTHRCAKCWLKKLRILIPLIAMPAPSSGCCSTSVAWSSRTAFRSPSSMKSTPGEISRVNHRWRCSRLTILWIRIVLIFCKTIIIPAKVVLIIQELVKINLEKIFKSTMIIYFDNLLCQVPKLLCTYHVWIF